MSVSLKELSYYLFFGLMIAAKGIGLDSGDKLYYLLSLLAVVCVFTKLIVTEYNRKELCAMGILVLIAFLAYINSGRLGIVLSALAIVGIKDIRISSLFRLGLVIYAISFAGTILCAVTGIIHNPFVVHEKGGIGEIIRWGMGYSTGNVFHASYFILVVFAVYHIGAKYKLKHALWFMAGNFLVFFYSLSYTGTIVTAFYLVLSLYAARRKCLKRAEQILCRSVLPLCLIFSFVTPFMLDTAIGQKLNGILQARPAFSYYYLTSQQITLLGTRMKDIPNFWVIMDNGYVYILMTFGVIAFLLFCAGYSGCIFRLSGIEGKAKELAVIFSFLIYGIMEQFISNAFMNISLFFIGNYFFSLLKSENKVRIQSAFLFSRLVDCGKKRVRLIKNIYLAPLALNKKKIRLWAFGFSACFLTGYFLFGERADFATVPITSVNYVDAQSVRIVTDKKYEDKEDLKRRMQDYEIAITNVQYIQGILDDLENTYSGTETGEEIKTVTPQKVTNILEFSLPQYVQNSKDYNAFRIRMLESYCNISSDTYGILLKQLIINLPVRETAGRDGLEIYPERIGKSFGEDRIEHIKDNEKYFVEKSGTIIWIENIRECISFILVGAAVGIILYIIIRKKSYV